MNLKKTGLVSVAGMVICTITMDIFKSLMLHEYTGDVTSKKSYFIFYRL